MNLTESLAQRIMLNETPISMQDMNDLGVHTLDDWDNDFMKATRNDKDSNPEYNFINKQSGKPVSNNWFSNVKKTDAGFETQDKQGSTRSYGSMQNMQDTEYAESVARNSSAIQALGIDMLTLSQCLKAIQPIDLLTSCGHGYTKTKMIAEVVFQGKTLYLSENGKLYRKCGDQFAEEYIPKANSVSQKPIQKTQYNEFSSAEELISSITTLAYRAKEQYDVSLLLASWDDKLNDSLDLTDASDKESVAMFFESYKDIQPFYMRFYKYIPIEGDSKQMVSLFGHYLFGEKEEFEGDFDKDFIDSRFYEINNKDTNKMFNDLQLMEGMFAKVQESKPFNEKIYTTFNRMGEEILSLSKEIDSISDFISVFVDADSYIETRNGNKQFLPEQLVDESVWYDNAVFPMRIEIEVKKENYNNRIKSLVDYSRNIVCFVDEDCNLDGENIVRIFLEPDYNTEGFNDAYSFLSVFKHTLLGR